MLGIIASSAREARDPNTVLELPLLSTYDDALSLGFTKVGSGEITFDDGYAYFPGFTYLASPAIPGLAFGTGEYTIESFVKFTSSMGGEKGYFQTTTAPGPQTSYADGKFGAAQSGSAVYYSWGTNSYSITPGGSVVQDIMYHIADYRIGDTIYVAVDGVIKATRPFSTADFQGEYITVGGYYSSAYSLMGGLAHFRVSNIARYPAENFTPPEL